MPLPRKEEEDDGDGGGKKALRSGWATNTAGLCQQSHIGIYPVVSPRYGWWGGE